MSQPEASAGRFALDERKKETIIAVVRNGSSRRVAARIVGCAPITITRTARRDPDFACRLARAEHEFELAALVSLQEAAKQPRHWRAAVWLLEHKNPDDFAPRRGPTLTLAEVAALFRQLAEILRDQISDEIRQRLAGQFNELLLQYETLDVPLVEGSEPGDAET